MGASLPVRGGAHIGWTHASWPLATLSITEGRLLLSVLLLGTYTFEPAEVIALERQGTVPFFTTGVRIVHSRLDIPRIIVFSGGGDPEKLTDRIRLAGFQPRS